MRGENGETILFCTGGCSRLSFSECPNAYGIKISHLNIEGDYLDEEGYVAAEIFCISMDCYDIFDMTEEVNHDI